MNEEYPYTTNEAKFHGFMLGVNVAKTLSERGEKIDLNSAICLMGRIADSIETLVDPEQSLENCDPQTAQILRNGTINDIENQRNHAKDAREGLNKIVASCHDQ